jgi:hypothetical protein
MAEARYVCLNSFPRSGNTWVRFILSHLLFDGTLTAIPDKYRQADVEPALFAHKGVTLRFYKSHDRFLSNRLGSRMIEHGFCVHIVRHPLDVFLSQLNFLTLPQSDAPARGEGWELSAGRIDETIASRDLEYFFGVFLVYGTLQPFFRAAGSWQQHARFWLRPPVRTAHLRYEQLASGDYSRLLDIARTLGKSETELKTAIGKASEDTRINDGFFWKQTPGLWREVLPKRPVERFYEANSALLAQLGYAC